MEVAAHFFKQFLELDVRHIAVENPVMHGHAKEIIGGGKERNPDFSCQPYQFGHDASKRTCWWTKNLPELHPTEIIEKETYANQTPSGQNRRGPSDDRSKERSRFWEGMAKAMAKQWGEVLR